MRLGDETGKEAGGGLRKKPCGLEPILWSAGSKVSRSDVGDTPW